MSRPLLLLKALVRAHTRAARDGRPVYVRPYATRTPAAQPELPLAFGLSAPRRASAPRATPRAAPPPAPAVAAEDYAPATVRGWDGERLRVPNVAHARLFNLGRRIIEGGTPDPAEVAALWEHFRGWVEHSPPTFPFARAADVPALALDYADRYSTAGARMLTAVVDPDEAAAYWQRGLELTHGHPLEKALGRHIATQIAGR